MLPILQRDLFTQITLHSLETKLPNNNQKNISYDKHQLLDYDKKKQQKLSLPVNKQISQIDAISLKNVRRISKLRKKKQENVHVTILHKALEEKNIVHNHLKNQVDILQNHVIAYKHRFEESLARQEEQKGFLESQKKLSQLSGLQEQLKQVNDLTNQLFLKNKLSPSQNNEVLKTIKKLHSLIEQKKELLLK
jgi:bacterioferritin (cytochrome b1)